jgi:hypothetical protein
VKQATDERAAEIKLIKDLEADALAVALFVLSWSVTQLFILNFSFFAL